MSRGVARRLAMLLVGVALLAVARGALAGDPYLRWYTLKTPHFRIHFHGGLELNAEHTANVAESVYTRLVPQLGWRPREVTEIILSDSSDGANGSASALPYNAIRLFVTAPEDMSPLGDYDDWLSELVTHEYTHILQIDNVSGIPALVNAIFGKTSVPNQAQPHFVLEGLAVVMESEHTSGGRLRSTQFDMYLRADVLEHHLAPLDQISHGPRRWPGGTVWYLYGAKFIEWIVDHYGPNTFAAVASDYGSAIVPWGINRSIRRVTSHTYEELYDAWRRELELKYDAQRRAIELRGLREGRRLTFRGFNASSPRFLPSVCAPGRHLVYFRDDGHDRAGLYELDLDAPDPDRDATLITRSSGGHVSVDQECGLVFDSVAPSRRLYGFDDLFRQAPGTRSTGTRDDDRVRLTVGARAREPDVSPDGRAMAYVTNRAGTTTLRLAHLDDEHLPIDESRLVPSARFAQAYTPRFSPDGRRLAYSAWTRGGFRDVRVVDVASGSFFELTHDRALDQQPCWSPDGKTLYFVSDRTGVANVYAYEFATRRLSQVTNVLNGAYMPEVSADGRTLVYVGYTSAGFDLFTLELDPSRFLEAPPAPETHPEPVEPSLHRRWPIEPYNPLPTLRPYAWDLSYGPGSFGNTFTISTQGQDAVGLHAYAIQLSLPPTEDAEAQGSLSYAYTRLPFLFRASAFRSAAFRHDYQYGGHNILTTEHLLGVSSGVSFRLPGEFDASNVSFTYTWARTSRRLPTGTLADPYGPVPTQPYQGTLATAGLRYTYVNLEGSAYAISAERGFTLSLGLDVADPAIASDYTLSAVSGTLTAFQLMPWARHHVLALALSAATATGSYPRRGLYATGGFTDIPLLNAYLGIMRGSTPLFDFFDIAFPQGPFVLRGYAPGQFIGQTYNLLNAEYRFPIWYADHGLSTLPFFLRTLSGTLFFDYGGAYDVVDRRHPFDQLHGSIGAELWVDTILGYAVESNLRLGVAHPLDDGMPSTRTYAVLSSAF